MPGLFYFYERMVHEREKGYFRGVIISSLLFSLFLAFSIFGGKPHVIIMGLLLLFIYAIHREVLVHGLISRHVFIVAPTRLIILIIAGILIASPLILPFTELLRESSLIAKQVRTGASSHTLPLISSITLWQPLFLGIKDYFYGSWLKWSPFYMVPYIGIIALILYIYATMRKALLIALLPFSFFSLFLFLKIYGILPNDLFIGIPVLEGTNFIKYNGMLFFALSVISAHAIEDIKNGISWRFYISLSLTSLILVIYFLGLKGYCPPERSGYITDVLIYSIAGVSIIGLLSYLSKRRYKTGRLLPYLLFFLMVAELYIYLPKEHPKRLYPYTLPPYIGLIKEDHPYRIIGNGDVIPPLISNVIGLYDIRDINVLIPNDYYLFFQNLLSFSVPYTNDPSPLIAGTSPISDLLGVKYILSNNEIDINRLKDELSQHLSGLRTIRYLNGFKSHGMKGSSGYGYFETGGERRFSFFFKPTFRFSAEVRITEPWLFVSAAMLGQDAQNRADIDIRIEGMDYTITVESGHWNDMWIDVSEFMGKAIDVVIESRAPKGPIAIGGIGLSKGKEWEDELLNRLCERHIDEYRYLEYKGQYSGLHLYENKNVMPRAFILHETKPVNTLGEAISELQDGIDFRRVALISDYADSLSSAPGEGDEGVIIKRYSPNRVEIDVDTKGGILVLSDLYYPGWKVKVNGKEGRIIRVFGLLRGVVIPEGRLEVIFIYRPVSFYAGVGISVITLGLWLFLIKRRG
ncbi:MAG: hypothetical protein Fur0020_06810 [Thermodesulfovibrionia bacterium]